MYTVLHAVQYSEKQHIIGDKDSGKVTPNEVEKTTVEHLVYWLYLCRYDVKARVWFHKKCLHDPILFLSKIVGVFYIKSKEMFKLLIFYLLNRIGGFWVGYSYGLRHCQSSRNNR